MVNAFCMYFFYAPICTDITNKTDFSRIRAFSAHTYATQCFLFVFAEYTEYSPSMDIVRAFASLFQHKTVEHSGDRAMGRWLRFGTEGEWWDVVLALNAAYYPLISRQKWQLLWLMFLCVFCCCYYLCRLYTNNLDFCLFFYVRINRCNFSLHTFACSKARFSCLSPRLRLNNIVFVPTA